MKCCSYIKSKISRYPRSSRTLRRGLFALIVWTDFSYGAGLGNIEIQSSLGQPLRASISLIGAEAKEQTAGCVKSKVESLDGVLAVNPRVVISQSESGATIRLTTRESINEPALNIAVELGCQASVRRVYQILLDPASTLATVASGPGAGATAAIITRKAPAARGSDTAETVVSATDTNPLVQTRKRPRNRVKALDANPDATLPPTDAPPKPAAKAKSGSRSVLRMAPVDDPIEDAKIALRLKFSDTLTIPAGGVFSSGPPAAPAIQDPAAMAARTEELVKTSQALELARLQTEAQALKSENLRIKKQEAAGKGAIDSMREEMLTWIQALGGVLAVCLAALAWLAWRLNAIRKEKYQETWRELFPESTEFDTSIDSNTDVDDNLFALEEDQHLQVQASPDTPIGLTDASDDFFDRRSVFVPVPVSPIELEKKSPQVAARKEPSPIELFAPPVSLHSAPTKLPEPETLERENPINWDGAPRTDVAPKVEEISDVMELVEVWMALHEPTKVLELLEPFSDLEQPASPLPWLCLLDVYASLNDREKYDAILARIKVLYNVKLTSWEARLDQHTPRVLADFPHVVDTILALWDSDDIGPYLDSLLVDDRDGVREGFDLPVYRDIARLTALANDPARPRNLAEMKNIKAYAPLFADPSPPIEIQEKPASTTIAKPVARAEKVAPKPDNKKDLPVRPTFLKSQFAPDAGNNSDAANSSTIRLEERESRSDVAGLPIAFSLEEPDIQRKSVIAGSSENDAVVGALNLARTKVGLNAFSQPIPADKTDFPYITQNEVSKPHQTGANKVIVQDEHDDPWSPKTWRGIAPPLPPTINKEMSPMAIKLHLAIAYQDIGDLEGACLLLNEVIADGTPDQCRQAKLLLAALA